MKSKLFKTINPYVDKVLSKVKKPTKLLLAVSGGQDSSVMLDYLGKLASRTDSIELVVAHFDHGLRKESPQERAFVEQRADLMNLKFVTKKAPNFDGSSNMESWAREQRYAFFEEQREKLSCDYVATAHHMKDQTETMIMRFFNGRLATKSCGISAIDKKRFSIRPFLYLSLIHI